MFTLKTFTDTNGAPMYAVQANGKVHSTTGDLFEALATVRAANRWARTQGK